jgi:hypothetical protein
VGKRVSGYNDCMGFFQIDPNVERLLPADIRIVNLHAEPNSEGNRLKVGMEISPFQQKPYIDLTLVDSTGQLITTTSIVEPVNSKLELNLHLRKLPLSQNGVYTLIVVISFPDLGEVDRRDLNIEIPYTSV